jgi:hypothetical protein
VLREGGEAPRALQPWARVVRRLLRGSVGLPAIVAGTRPRPGVHPVSGPGSCPTPPRCRPR